MARSARLATISSPLWAKQVATSAAIVPKQLKVHGTQPKRQEEIPTVEVVTSRARFLRESNTLERVPVTSSVAQQKASTLGITMEGMHQSRKLQCLQA